MELNFIDASNFKTMKKPKKYTYSKGYLKVKKLTENVTL